MRQLNWFIVDILAYTMNVLTLSMTFKWIILKIINGGFNLPFIKDILNVFHVTWSPLAFKANISL